MVEERLLVAGCCWLLLVAAGCCWLLVDAKIGIQAELRTED